MKSISDKIAEKLETHILCPVTFFRQSFRLWEYVDQYCRAGQATDDKMALPVTCWIPVRLQIHTQIV